MLTGVHHAGIGVRDMEVSLRFYRDLLGLQVVEDYEAEGPLLDAIVGLENAKTRIVALACGNQVVELFQYSAPSASSFPTSYRQCDGGIIHVAFLVDNLIELYDTLTTHGFQANSRPFNMGGQLCVYVHDPDGVTVELLQPGVEP